MRVGFSKMTVALERMLQEKMDGLFERWEAKLDSFKEVIHRLENEVKQIKHDQQQYEHSQIEMKADIERLKVENEELKYAANSNKLEITGLICENDNAVTLEESVHKLLNVLQVSDVQGNVTVIGKVDGKHGSKVLLECENTRQKNKILKQAKLIRPKMSLINDRMPDRAIYLNHCMTPYFKKIYYEAKQKKLLKGYKFLWITNSGIFIKKSENTKAIKINCLTKLDEL
jgi:FtsZ-binding cell division protein ZapB